MSEDGKPATGGDLVQIGGNSLYIPVSRKLHKKALETGEIDDIFFREVKPNNA